MNECGVHALHADPAARQRYEIGRGPLWILRHHPDPAPLTCWLLLDAGGALHFTAAEASACGLAVQKAFRLVQQLSGCDRVYAITFGEGARHLHLHLIPRFGSDPQSEAWKVADLHRAVACGERPPASADAIQAYVNQARHVLEAAEHWP